ncbi:MAG: hypothetical protein ACI8XU_000211 [Kiritimatiellia bacterium]|jgi:hypothetical protein
MSNKSLVSLASLRQNLKSGDVVFFQGLASDSMLIRGLTGGIWSHCAMIIKGDDIGCTEHDLLLFESSVTPGRDIGESGKDSVEKAGVMLVDFDQRMEDYAQSREYSMFGIRQLGTDRAQKADTEELKTFALNRNVRDSVYPAEQQVVTEHFVARDLDNSQFNNQALAKIQSEIKIDAIKNLTDTDLKLIISKAIETVHDNLDSTTHDKFSHRHTTPSHYFCSELVVDALMHMGVMEMGNAAGYSPSDLSNEADSLLDASYLEVKHIPGDLGRD